MSIVISKAVWGSVNKGIDVTQKCQSIVATGNDDIAAENATFDNDPDVGAAKNLTISYTNNAHGAITPLTVGCPEHSTVDLVPTTILPPLPQPLASPQVTILQAFFASPNRGWDVTKTCQWMTSNGATKIAANIANFGDPDPGAGKVFSVAYKAVNGNTVHYQTCKESNTLNLLTS